MKRNEKSLHVRLVYHGAAVIVAAGLLAAALGILNMLIA